MGVTNDFGQKAFNRQGSAVFEVWDAILSSYRYLGRTAGVGYMPETSKIQQRAPIKGISRITQERTTAVEGMLSFTLMEQMAPDVAQLLFGDPSIDQTLTAGDIVGDKQIKTLYNTDVQFLTNEYGLVPNVTTTVTIGTPSAAGGGALAGSFFFWVIPVYGTTANIATNNGAAGWSTELDINYTGEGVASGTHVVSGTTASFTIADLTTTGPTPDSWAVFFNTSDDIVTSTLLAKVAGGASTTGAMTPPEITTPTVYAAPIGLGVETIASYSTGTAVFTKTTSGTDFTYDSVEGTLARIAGGGIAHGVDVRVTAWNWNPEYVTTKIGAPVSNQDVRQIRVTSFEGETDKLSTDQLLAEGERFIFYRVNFSGTTPNYTYTEEDFHDGANIEVTCQYDSTQANIGEHQGWSKKFANFVQNYA
ncbi:hypothetical protein LCGC14_1830690 [marine sediment metagenome]|uniref:Uncharacterized protein n=1 Tax=marine sediment metagenome TaxID=412755 RepID=A0A0F9H4B9_9ZZZZ